MTHKLILSLLIGGLLLSCAPKNVQQINWKQSNKFNSELPRNYDSETKIAYELANDQQHLYLKVLVNDETTQRQLMMSGMQIWIDTTKKYKENFGLNFPLKSKGPQKSEKPQNQGPPQLSEMKEAYIKSQNQFRAENLKSVKDGLNPIKNEDGIIVQLDFDEQGSLIYNAKIPLTCFFIHELAAIDSTKLFSLRIKIPGVELPSGPPGGGQSGPPGGGGGGRPGGGGPPGGGPGGQGPQGQSGMSGMTSDKEVKLRFQLSIKN